MSFIAKFIIKSGFGILFVMPGGAAVAQQKIDSQIQVVVQTGSYLSQSQALEFETASHVSSLSMASTSTFEISSAVPSTIIDITLPESTVPLNCDGCVGLEPTTTIGSFAVSTDGSDHSLSITTDDTGSADFVVSATLSVDPIVDDLENGSHSGEFTIVANY